MEAECFENIVSVPAGVGPAIVLCCAIGTRRYSAASPQLGALQVQFHYPLGAQGGWLILGRPRLTLPAKRSLTVLVTRKALLPGEGAQARLSWRKLLGHMAVSSKQHTRAWQASS